MAVFVEEYKADEFVWVVEGDCFINVSVAVEWSVDLFCSYCPLLC